MKIETFEITKEEDQELGATRYTVKGRVNSKSSAELKNKLEDAVRRGEKYIVLNMREVGYLSSDGIRAILGTHKEAAKAGGKFGIENPSEMVRNVLGMVALNDLLI